MTFMCSLFFLTLPGVLLPGVLGMPLGVGRSVALTRKTMRLHRVKGAHAFRADVVFTLYSVNPWFRVKNAIDLPTPRESIPRLSGICSEDEGGRERSK